MGAGFVLRWVCEARVDPVLFTLTPTLSLQGRGGFLTFYEVVSIRTGYWQDHLVLLFELPFFEIQKLFET